MYCPKCDSEDVDVYDKDEGTMSEIWECSCADCGYSFEAKLCVYEIDGKKIPYDEMEII